MMKTSEQILSQLPYKKPFLFVDKIERVDQAEIAGSFYLDPKLEFYQGHFVDYPITPGVILTEIMAQIGVASLGIYLTGNEAAAPQPFAMSEIKIDFLKPVYPDTVVTVIGKKQYFRFGKLKCFVQMFDEAGTLLCEGTIAGIKINLHE